MRVYSDPERESETYSLPDVEVFYMGADDFLTADEDTWICLLYTSDAADE